MRWAVAASATLLLVPVLLVPAVLLAYKSGAGPGVTGGFGEPTCAQCHRPASGGAPAAARALAFAAPKAYRAGETYRLRITIARPGLEVGGFEVSARYRSGAANGRQAGTLRAADGRAQVTAANGVQYAQHTEEGTAAATPGKLTWVVVWQAPPKPAGDVVFHVVANAANGDSSALGDTIYTAEAVARPAAPGGKRP